MQLDVQNKIYSTKPEPPPDETQEISITLTIGMYKEILDSIENNFMLTGDFTGRQQVINSLADYEIIEPMILFQGGEVTHFYQLTAKGRLIASEVQKSPRTIRLVETYRRNQAARLNNRGNHE